VHAASTCERGASTATTAAPDLEPALREGRTAGSATATGPPVDAAIVGRQRSPRWLTASRYPLLTVRAAVIRHPALRYLQIIPVALVLWGLDAAVMFRAGADVAGMRDAPVVDQISGELGGGFARQWNGWLLGHSILGTAASWYYVILHGAVAGVVGIWLIWRRTPRFALHRDALIATNVIGLLAFWFYPVAPPRMLPGYHDITGINVPFFSGFIEGKAADQFAALPSLHVVWALWVAVALSTTLRTPALRIVVWLYPVATVLDVLATANHYWLDVITAPAVLVLAYALAAVPEYIRRHGLRMPRGLPVAVRSRADAR
jgi:hypothetical protein